VERQKQEFEVLQDLIAAYSLDLHKLETKMKELTLLDKLAEVQDADKSTIV
jgi:hypothetical protein